MCIRDRWRALHHKWKETSDTHSNVNETSEQTADNKIDQVMDNKVGDSVKGKTMNNTDDKLGETE